MFHKAYYGLELETIAMVRCFLLKLNKKYNCTLLVIYKTLALPLSRAQSESRITMPSSIRFKKITIRSNCSNFWQIGKVIVRLPKVRYKILTYWTEWAVLCHPRRRFSPQGDRLVGSLEGNLDGSSERWSEVSAPEKRATRSWTAQRRALLPANICPLHWLNFNP